MREICEDLILICLLILKYKIFIEVLQKNYYFSPSTSPVVKVHNLVLI